MSIGVVLERREVDHPWQSHEWVGVAVIPGAPEIGEWRLLDELGYAFSLHHDVNEQPIATDGLYRLRVDAGLERVELAQPGLFRGTELLAMAQTDWDATRALLAAKRLMRQALAVHLGAKPLVSRELFRKR